MSNPLGEIHLKRGDTGVYDIPVTNADGDPVPLPSGLKVWFTAKSDMSAVDASAEIAVGTTNTGRTGVTYDQTSGVITVTIPASVSLAIEEYVLQYDCQIEGTGISIRTVDEGFVYLTDQVTKST